MKIFMLLTVLAALFLLGGCIQYWYQPGKTFEQCKQDKDQCTEELNKRSEHPTLEYRQKFMENCMKEKGYRLVGENEVPLDAKREGIESDNYWLTRGIAGQLDSNQ